MVRKNCSEQLVFFQALEAPADHRYAKLPSESTYSYGCRCRACKDAHNENQKAYHKRKWVESEEYRDWYRAKSAAHSRKVKTDPLRRGHINDKARGYQQKNRARVAALKIQKGCADCGYNTHHAALDFDHITGNKLYQISKMSNFSWERILAEIQECEVVCANCHRIRTYERTKAD